MPKHLPRLLPKPSSSSLDPLQAQLPQPNTLAGSAATEPPSKRIKTACNNCRKRKLKCDGRRPECSTCERYKVQCVFSAPEGVTQVAAERQQMASYRSVIGLLQQGSTVDSITALQRLREGAATDETVASLSDAQLLLSIPSSSQPLPFTNNDPIPSATHKSDGGMKRRLASPYDDSDFMFEQQFRSHAWAQYVNPDIFIDVSSGHLPLSRWTTVSTDDRHMNHLLELFFTWDNIVERTIHRPMFEEDVVAMDASAPDESQHKFCSHFLVNALLALSCLYTMNPATFKYSQDPTSRGRRWADEAENLLESVKKPSLPLLQGLLAMFCYEGNLGSGTKSVPYFMRAIDVYKALCSNEFQYHPEDAARRQREIEATSWCIWGFYCCEWRGSHALGLRKPARKPQLAKEWREPNFTLLRQDCSGYWWRPYPMSLRLQPSMQVEVREVDALLSELAEEVMDFIFPDVGALPPSASPQRALELYDALVEWKYSLPSRIRFEEAVLPSTILLHISMELLFTAILRPFAHKNKEQFGRFTPRERCCAHAASLVTAAWTFRAFAEVRFEYWLCHPLGTAAYIVLQDSLEAPAYMDTLVRACQCLQEMETCLPLGADVLSGIQAAFKSYKLDVPAYMTKYFDSLQARRDGLMHHTVAALMPSHAEAAGGEVQLQELLDEFASFVVD